MENIHTKQKILSNDLILQLAGLGLGQTLHNELSFLDENDFLTMAANEGCTGLIYYNLIHHQPAHNFSSTVCDHLEQEYLVNTGRNILIDKQLDEICARFEKKQVRTLTVRGSVFFDQIYPELGVRPLIDMDFVVRQNDFDCAKAALKELGFEYNECYPFFFYKDDIYADLHLNSINFWRIKNWPSAIDITNEKLWQRTISYRNNTCIRTLDCYDTIIHCSEHLMRHSFERLIWFLDIAYLVRKQAGTFQWNQLVFRAKEHRAQKAVYYVLSYLNKMNFCIVPLSILQELGKVQFNMVEKKNFHLLLANQRVNLSGDLMSLCAIESQRQRLQALWNGIFIEQEKFPLVRTKLTPVSYLKRFFRLVGYIFKKSISLIKTPSLW